MQELEKILEEIEIRAIKDLEEENDRCSTTYKGCCSDVKERKCNCRDAIIVRAFKKLAKCINDDWISVEERLPEDDDFVLATVTGIYNALTFSSAIQLASYCKDDGWFIEGYPDWENPNVSAWKPLTEPYRPERSDNHDGE